MNFYKVTIIFFLIIAAFNIASAQELWENMAQPPINAWCAATTRVGQNTIWALLKNTPGNEHIRIYNADSVALGSWDGLWTPATRRRNTAHIAWDTIENHVHILYVKQDGTPSHIAYDRDNPPTR